MEQRKAYAGKYYEDSIQTVFIKLVPSIFEFWICHEITFINPDSPKEKPHYHNYTVQKKFVPKEELLSEISLEEFDNLFENCKNIQRYPGE